MAKSHDQDSFVVEIGYHNSSQHMETLRFRSVKAGAKRTFGKKICSIRIFPLCWEPPDRDHDGALRLT